MSLFSSETSSPPFWTLALVHHMCPCLARLFLVARLGGGCRLLLITEWSTLVLRGSVVLVLPVAGGQGFKAYPVLPGWFTRAEGASEGGEIKSAPARCTKQDLHGVMQGFSWALCLSETGNLPLSIGKNGSVGPVAPRLVAVLSWETGLAWPGKWWLGDTNLKPQAPGCYQEPPY